MMDTVVVRAWGSGKCHVAEVPDELRYRFTVFGSEGDAVEAPVATLCRVTLKAEPVVVMRKAKVGCVTCARISGISTVGEGE